MENRPQVYWEISRRGRRYLAIAWRKMLLESLARRLALRILTRCTAMWTSPGPAAIQTSCEQGLRVGLSQPGADGLARGRGLPA